MRSSSMSGSARGESYRCSYVTGGQFAPQFFSFTTREHLDRWNSQVLLVKQTITQVNEQNPGGGGTSISRRHEIYRPWISMVRAFVADWGKAYVPEDIRWALNDVEKACSEEVTSW